MGKRQSSTPDRSNNAQPISKHYKLQVLATCEVSLSVSGTTGLGRCCSSFARIWSEPRCHRWHVSRNRPDRRPQSWHSPRHCLSIPVAICMSGASFCCRCDGCLYVSTRTTCSMDEQYHNITNRAKNTPTYDRTRLNSCVYSVSNNYYCWEKIPIKISYFLIHGHLNPDWESALMIGFSLPVLFWPDARPIV